MSLLSIVTVFRLEQPEKAPLPMPITLFGMVTEDRPLQSSKAQSYILVTLLGMVTYVRLLQPEKAELPMLVTPSGMVMEVREVTQGLCATTEWFFISNPSVVSSSHKVAPQLSLLVNVELLIK